MDYINLNYGSATLACTVEGEDIIQVDMLGNRKVIGKTAEAYQALEEVTREYYTKLVELGVIVPQKSQEEMMQDMAALIAQLSQEVKELKENGHAAHTCRCGADVPQREPDGGSETG